MRLGEMYGDSSECFLHGDPKVTTAFSFTVRPFISKFELQDSVLDGPRL
jgi:hypothetical protein